MALPPHIPIAFKLLPHLIDCAKSGRRTTYEDMGKAVGMESRLFSRPLAFIRDFVCVQHSLPPLTVLVDRKSATTASSSFDPEHYASLTRDAYVAYEKEMVQKVFDYSKWDMALTGLLKVYGAK